MWQRRLTGTLIREEGEGEEACIEEEEDVVNRELNEVTVVSLTIVITIMEEGVEELEVEIGRT